MAEETQKNDLGSLSQAWSERVRSIREMVQKVKPAEPAESVEPVVDVAAVPDDELFNGPIFEDYSAQQIFAGSEEFLETIDSTPDFVPGPSSHKATPDRHERTLFSPKFLVGAIILVALVVLSYGLFTYLPLLQTPNELVATAPPQAVSVNVESVSPVAKQEPEVLLNEDHPVSLKIAQEYYLQGDYKYAFAVYQQLLENLPEGTEDDGLRDFLKLKMALCMKEVGNDEQMASLLKAVSQSRFPIVRAFANYHLCRLEMQMQQYLTARSRAYQAVALFDIAAAELDCVKELRRNCYFLAAEAMSRQVFALSDADKELPGKLWPHFDTGIDPFEGYDEKAIRVILNTGVQRLNRALLEPKVQAHSEDDLHTWTVHSSGASIDELMGRFSVNAECDVQWNIDSDKTRIRSRSVSIYLKAAAGQDCVTVMAGSAGLLATLDENNVITICDPTEYLSVSEQVSLLRKEAMSCWQRFILAHYGDPYLPNAHFASAVLKGGQNMVAESLGEYKMIANRFFRSDLAPAALTNSAILKIRLQDDSGAYSDLKEVTEQYPDYEKIDQSRLLLADTGFRIGRDAEAAKLYEKVYYLNSSPKAQSDAALQAGRLFYQIQDFTNAEKWFSRYIDLETVEQDRHFYEVCLSLGKIWQATGKSQLACNALQASLCGPLSRVDYIEAVNALVEEYMDQEHFIEALNVLNKTDSRNLSQEQSVKMLLFKSRVLRELGLIEKAIMMLKDREGYLVNNDLKTEIGCELSECYIEQEQLDLAHKKLARVVETANPGPLANQAMFKLADVCFRLGMADQAMELCSRLLYVAPGAPMEQRTLELLATVYDHQENYDRATLALLGQWQ